MNRNFKRTRIGFVTGNAMDELSLSDNGAPVVWSFGQGNTVIVPWDNDRRH